MAASTASFEVARALSGIWLVSTCMSALAGPVIMANEPPWHAVRGNLQQLGEVQMWISIAACVGLLVISRKKHSETEQAWAQGALLIYVLGGLLSVLVLNFGALPKFLVQSNNTLAQMQVVMCMLLHGLCACLALRSLRKHGRSTSV
jgi:O-antigen/teichoic acid export membrane protein